MNDTLEIAIEQLGILRDMLRDENEEAPKLAASIAKLVKLASKAKGE